MPSRRAGWVGNRGFGVVDVDVGGLDSGVWSLYLMMSKVITTIDCICIYHYCRSTSHLWGRGGAVYGAE